MKRDEFRGWLEKSGRAPSATKIRVSYVAGIERRMRALGSPFETIDAAYDADGLEQLRTALAAMTRDYQEGGTTYRALMPNSDGSRHRLNGFRNALESYVRFRRMPDLPAASAPGEDVDVPPPTNLILYGPPGTGKTYATAAEAVRLCDGEVPEKRSELMTRYAKLREAGQIRFVTFHQSYSYEDFVEGLRPVSPDTNDAGSDSDGPGFRLAPVKGVFREICARAEQARKRGGSAPFEMGERRVFKMSLGRAGVEDEVYDAALAGGYIVLGWGGEVDWSDPAYKDFEAVKARWNEIEPGVSGNSGNVAQVWSFRGYMREGDLVVVSAGNHAFRAIGEITGDYRYDPTGFRTYNHRRDVRWLLVLDEPLAVEEIYGKPFTQQSCYRLAEDHLKREALSRLLPGADVEEDLPPDQFVLVIDEINRANVSKVLGELITLLESDKRLGAENEIRLTLPYSGDAFGVPDNLHIVGTMNTADRSIALLDTALRRRFEFRELMPNPDLLAAAGTATGLDLAGFLRRINERIEYLVDRERQVGHAYLMACRTRAEVDEAMRFKVIPLLQEYFFEDWSKVAFVLGDPSGQRFLERRTLKPPPGLAEDGAEPRESWRVRDVFTSDAYDPA